MAEATRESTANRPVLSGRYELRRRIARGGMAEVFEGFDRRLSRLVAVKVIHDGGDPTFAERLRREAEAAARVVNPHVVNVYDVGDHEGSPFLVMEHVDGASLAETLRREGHLSVERAVAIANSVLEALDAAHSIGVVHRDVKPGNILLASTGAVKLSDFGIAMVTGDLRNRLTATNLVMGSPSYLAPERARGEPGSPRSDLYSVGVVLYEMLTGRPPFAADNPSQLAMAHQSEHAVPVHELRTDIPEALSAVIAIAMAKEPERRFRDAAAMRTALARARTPEARRASFAAVTGASALDGERTTQARTEPRTGQLDRSAHPAAPPRSPRRSPHRSRRRTGWAAVLAVMAVGAGGAVALVTRPDEGGNAEPTVPEPVSVSTTLPAAPPVTTSATTAVRTTAPSTVATTIARTTVPVTTVGSTVPPTTARPTTTAPPTTTGPSTVAALISEVAADPDRHGYAGGGLLDQLNQLQGFQPNTPPYKRKVGEILDAIKWWVDHDQLTVSMANRARRVLEPLVA